MPYINPDFLRSTWQDVKQQRGRYPWLIFMAVVLMLSFELVPAEYMPWPRWLLLIGALSWLICAVDFNMMLWRLHKRRNDLKPVRFTLMLLGMFISLLALGRVLGLASLFNEAMLGLASLVNLVSGALALVLVLMARSVEDYAVSLPALADLQAANQERNEAVLQLSIREKDALEGMTVLAGDTIVEANPAAYRIFGYDPSKNELIGMRTHQLLHEDDNPQVYAAMKVKRSAPYQVRILCKDGSIKQVETTGTVMSRHDTEIRLTCFRDVTFERRYEALLDTQAEGLAPNEALVQELARLRAYFHSTANAQ